MCDYWCNDVTINAIEHVSNTLCQYKSYCAGQCYTTAAQTQLIIQIKNIIKNLKKLFHKQKHTHDYMIIHRPVYSKRFFKKGL